MQTETQCTFHAVGWLNICAKRFCNHSKTVHYANVGECKKRHQKSVASNENVKCVLVQV